MDLCVEYNVLGEDLKQTDVTWSLSGWLLVVITTLLISSGAHAVSMRVLTLNIRVSGPSVPNHFRDGPGDWYLRLADMEKVIRKYDPDVFSIQEFEDEKGKRGILKSKFPDYYVILRARGGIENGREGIGIFAKKSRFSANLSSSEFQFDCTSWKKRNIVSVALFDNMDKQTIEVFGIHADAHDCREKYVDQLIRRVHDSKEQNIIVLGDLNDGIDKLGKPMKFYNRLLNGLSEKNVFLKNTYIVLHPTTPYSGFGTERAEFPAERQNTMIDHILVSPSFKVKNSGIDRTIFLNKSPFVCDEQLSSWDTDGKSYHCFTNQKDFISIKPFDGRLSYSDHWAVWAEVDLNANVDPPLL